ncbi:FkbM family methyltransferase [Parasegetibacter sp. NRK P23]|uniref:FkbM family methyltransferase n=1 Tax=Parasegetibacter sp. NRK P23 TaxID=2942999 RepID=UPI002043AEBE|nr:FkbM family methyltransferase [Parasegetibacter sp. NRK P23]MCM5527630.1 FkbM family methyltransferase [Parasegetibacter sp. NRK P23]
MKRKLSRLIKKMLVSTGLDNYIADLHHKTHWWLLQKLLPDRTFYNAADKKTITRYGVNFVVAPADFSQWLLFVDRTDTHVNAALTCLKDGENAGVILDVGANCGNFSLIMAQTIRNKGWNKEVVAFEPNPIVFSRFMANLALNPQLTSIVKVVNKGVGHEQSQLELQLPLRNSGAGSLVRNYEHEPHEKHLVDIVKLDAFFEGNSQPIEFIKIDVENFEYFVLQGANQIIGKHKPAIYLEMGNGQLNQNEIFNFFHQHGYLLYGEQGSGFIKIATIQAYQPDIHRNILARAEGSNEPDSGRTKNQL